MPQPRILVIGSTNTDMVIDLPTLPAPGETVLGGEFRMTPGGKGANQAVAAARAGGAVTFISAVGDDAFGADSVRNFQRDGIDTRYIVTSAGAPSGVAFILVDRQGENMIAVASGANLLLTPAHVTAAGEAFTGAAMLILQMEIPPETNLRAAELAKAAGVPVLLNPAPMPPGGLPEPLLRLVDILTPNEGELQRLFPAAAGVKEAAALALTRGPRTLVVTQGRRGATVFLAEETFSLPALAVQTIDTVGAGDCFSACLGVALAEGKFLREAVQFAISAAALSTTVAGAQAAMPVRGEIERAGKWSEG